MSATRVLVTGALGQVGRDLVDTLGGFVVPGAATTARTTRPVGTGEFDVLGLNHHDLDVTDAAAVQRALDASRPDVVVNLAAYTAVDRAEDDAERCYAVNCDAVGTLSAECASVGAHFITLSTDYVFDGRKGSPYVEDDPAHPLNVYGTTKLNGEQRCSSADTVVRTSWVMGVRARNIVHVILERVRQGESVRFVTDQRGSPTFSADLSVALVDVIRERPTGVFHVVNDGDATWYDVAQATAQLATSSDALVTAITSDELDPHPAARRPARSDLDTSKWVSHGFVALAPWHDGLRRLVADC